jgi:hypothetical protein
MVKSSLLPVGAMAALVIISAAPTAEAAPESVAGGCVMFCDSQPASPPTSGRCSMFCAPPAPPRDESACGQFCVLNNSWDRGSR